jgi:hypothetical protein
LAPDSTVMRKIVKSGVERHLRQEGKKVLINDDDGLPWPECFANLKFGT